MGATEQQAQEFGEAFRSFLDWVHQGAAGDRASEVVVLVRAHLAADAAGGSVVTREVPVFDHVNLQVALDAWTSAPGRSVRVQGVVVPPHYGGLTLQGIISAQGLPPIQLTAPELVDLPSGPQGRTTACWQRVLLLVDDAAGRYVVMVRIPDQHGNDGGISVEVAGLDVAAAQALHAELRELRSRLNVYRGHVLELVQQRMGGIALAFSDLPATPREDVVLPDQVLRRIERHTVDVATHRDELLAAGQHLKRGVLLYGPPGTGKTHTTRYVVGALAGCTVLQLAGGALHLISVVTGLARELQPSVIVLEDVDLVAEDRGHGMGGNPVLFELLDAMDGAAADADLLFLLTTNRADVLEPALAARPGRVDVAVEIGLPDAAARERLFRLYSRGVPLDLAPAELERVVERTAGTTASFVRELIRRSVLEAVAEQTPLREVTFGQVETALDDLLDSSQQVTRALLGVPREELDGGLFGPDDVQPW